MQEDISHPPTWLINNNQDNFVLYNSHTPAAVTLIV